MTTTRINESIGKRTGIDFSKHEVIETKTENFAMYHLKKSNTYTDSIKYINAGGVLAVTGDYGNWIFCREFHPNDREGVSDGYWEEKLKISSTQEPEEFDQEHTQSEIEAMLNGGLEEYGYTGEKLKEMKEYFTECLRLCDDRFDYEHYAYRNYPSFCDHETVIYRKKTKYWLRAVFDGFDEMCRRMKSITPSKTKPPLLQNKIKQSNMANIPTQRENPKGLHQRYRIQKIDKQGNIYTTDPRSEYFVMRLDEGGSDIKHIKACRIGVHAYADAIEHYLPELAKDLRERYPLFK